MTTLLEQINKILVPHKYLWDELTKEEKDQRKDEWKKINHSLKVLGRIEFRGSYMKAHKELFMNGVVRQPFLETIDTLNTHYGKEIGLDELTRHESGWKAGGVEFAGAFPLFYLWYLPKMNSKLADEIFEHFTQDLFESGGVYWGLCGARVLLWDRFVQGDYSANGGYWAIGPRMAYIAPRLIGEKGRKPLFDQKAPGADNRFVYSVDKFIPRMDIKPVLSGNEFSVNQMNRFIWPQASWYVKVYLEYLLDPETARNVRVMEGRRNALYRVIESIEYLIFFDEHPETSKECDFALECRDQILSQYQNDEFSPEMNTLFEMVESRGLGNTSVDDVLESIQ